MKWAVNEEDVEDYEQERRIKDWLDSNGNGSFEYQYINSKGNARNSLIRAAISLDQKISEDGSGTFADLVAGSDGRDLESGHELDESPEDPIDKLTGALLSLGFKEGEIECLINLLKKSLTTNKSRLKKLAKDLEW